MMTATSWEAARAWAASAATAVLNAAYNFVAMHFDLDPTPLEQQHRTAARTAGASLSLPFLPSVACSTSTDVGKASDGDGGVCKQISSTRS